VSGNPVTFTIDAGATSICSISAATVSFTGAGTCLVDANQAGNATYNAAPQAQQSFVVGMGSQAITFTSTPPSGAAVGGPTYTVTAVGGGSGNPVTFTIDASASTVCAISGAAVSFTGVGTCTIDADQAGNASYNAAPTAMQPFTVGMGSQAITFTSTPPSPATVGGPTYTVTATGGASGNPVTFTIDASATAVCSISTATVTFTATGTCVVDADQAGNTTYNAAPQAQQSFPVTSASADPAISATGRLLHGQVGEMFFGKVATFTDPDLRGTSLDYTATINWGDGRTTTGFIFKVGNGTFMVFGFHVWRTAGTLTVTITISDDDSTTPTTTVTDTATVHRDG
ncbi:MAG TPA: hypothetical protein VFO60_09165, partial [Candidatus Dormibacteraeota bacterium]|nr:hypothetical protein [Candidatus Dormibacteraeota bacterium]